MSGIRGPWTLITSLRLEDHAHLAPWHLWAALILLGLAAGFGLHYLLGYVFRFYWRAGRFQWWIAILALPVLMVSVLALVWAYILAAGAPRLIHRLLDEPEEGQLSLASDIGVYLLQPAFDLAGSEPGAPGPTGGAIAGAFAAMTQDELREALGAPARSPAEASGAPEPAPEAHGEPDGEAAPEAAPRESPPPPDVREPMPPEVPELLGPQPAILDIVRAWITDPDQTWPDRAPGEAERPSGQEPGAALSPNDYIPSLIGEVPAEAALAESDWAYIAGYRFSERVVRSMLTGYLRRGALAVVIALLLFNLGYFWVISRMNRPPAAAKTTGTAKGAPPQPADPLKREVRAP